MILYVRMDAYNWERNIKGNLLPPGIFSQCPLFLASFEQLDSMYLQEICFTCICRYLYIWVFGGMLMTMVMIMTIAVQAGMKQHQKKKHNVNFLFSYSSCFTLRNERAYGSKLKEISHKSCTHLITDCVNRKLGFWSISSKHILYFKCKIRKNLSYILNVNNSNKHFHRLKRNEEKWNKKKFYMCTFEICTQTVYLVIVYCKTYRNRTDIESLKELKMLYRSGIMDAKNFVL